jgi:Flp pilus assembly protein TadG
MRFAASCWISYIVRSPLRADPGGRHDDRGSITAEFAAVVPAVILVLVCCLGGLQVVGQQLRLQDAAAGAARSLARGESVGTVSARVSQSVSAATLRYEHRGGMLCAHLRAGAGGMLGAITVGASSCAIAGGQ